MASVYNDVVYDTIETKDLQQKDNDQLKKKILALEDWEKGLMTPLWTEDKDWNQVTFEIRKALMKKLKSLINSSSDLQRTIQN